MKLSEEELEQRAIDIRREQVANLLACGYRSYAEISRRLNISPSTVARDVAYFRDKASERLNEWISNEIPVHLWESMTV
jgi:DNA-directed RNA polymerase specialized sigma24 family protein